MKILFQISILSFLIISCTGCASLALIDKTSDVVENPRDIIFVVKTNDGVIVKYNTSLISASREVVFGTNYASFQFPHVPGTNIVQGKRLDSPVPEEINNTSHISQEYIRRDPPLDILQSEGMVVWGQYLNQSQVIELLPDGSIAWNKLKVDNYVHEKGFWALPTRIILFPGAVVLDIAYFPLIIAISPLLFISMAHCE